MSALGQKRTYAVQKGMSALPPKVDMWGMSRLVAKGARPAAQDQPLGGNAAIESLQGSRSGSATHREQHEMRRPIILTGEWPWHNESTRSRPRR